MTSSPVADLQAVSGGQLVDAAEHRRGCRDELIADVLVQRLKIDVAGDEVGGQHGFDLGSEHQLRAIPTVIKRFDAQPVTREHERLGPSVPDGEPKLPLKPLDALVAVLFPFVDDDFGVAPGLELVAVLGQVASPVGVVVDSRR